MKGGDPDETDLGFLEPLGTFDTPNAIQRYKYVCYACMNMCIYVSMYIHTQLCM